MTLERHNIYSAKKEKENLMITTCLFLNFWFPQIACGLQLNKYTFGTILKKIQGTWKNGDAKNLF